MVRGFFSKICVLGFFTVVLSTMSARANLVLDTVGPPHDGGSWFQGFSLTSSTAFDNLGLVLIDLDGTSGFEDPAWDFDALDGNPYGFAEWATVGDFLTVASTSSGSTNTLTWTSHFAGDGVDPLENDSQNFVLTFFAWDSDLIPSSFQRGVASWDGAGWDFRTGEGVSWEEFSKMGGSAGVLPTLPVPSAVLLGMLGLSLTGYVRWRQG